MSVARLLLVGGTVSLALGLVFKGHLPRADEDPHVARQLRGLRVGDQVRIGGQLASYSHDAGFAFTRGTSLTREDTGNGACETIFVREVQLLRRTPAWPQWLRGLGAVLLALGLAAWFAAPHRPRS